MLHPQILSEVDRSLTLGAKWDVKANRPDFNHLTYTLQNATYLKETFQLTAKAHRSATLETATVAQLAGSWAASSSCPEAISVNWRRVVVVVVASRDVNVNKLKWENWKWKRKWKVRFTLGHRRSAVHVIKINLRYATSDRGGQKGKRPKGNAGLGWAAASSVWRTTSAAAVAAAASSSSSAHRSNVFS